MRSLGNLSESLNCVIKQSMNVLFPMDIECEKYNKDYLDSHKCSASHRLSAARTIYFLEPNNQDHALTVAATMSDIIGVTMQVGI